MFGNIEKLRMAALAASVGMMVGVPLVRAADPAPAQPNPPAQQQAKPPQPGNGQPPPPGAPGPGGPRRGFNPLDMLKHYRDQFENVELTDDQMAKIDKFLETAEKNVKDLAASNDPDSRREMFQAMRTLDDDVQSILTDQQKQALRVQRQKMMFEQFTKPYKDPKLKLSDDQQKKVTEILDAARKKMEAAATAGGDPRQQMMATFQMMGDLRKQVSAILTPEQQALLPQFGPPGGRRGPGGPGGGPGGPGGGPGGPGGGPGGPGGGPGGGGGAG